MSKSGSKNTSMCLIDTNAIIDSINKEKFRQNIVNYLKGKNIKLVVCKVVFDEAAKPKKLETSFWPGYSKTKTIEKLREYFKFPIMTYEANQTIIDSSKELEKKHQSRNLHWPDSVLLAIAIKESWDTIITGDDALQKCCKEEKISFFDQALVQIEKPVERKVQVPTSVSHLTFVHVKVGNLPAFNSFLKKIIAEKDTEYLFALIFSELSDIWYGLRKYDTNWDEEKFNKFFRTTIFNLQKKDPVFKRLEGIIFPSDELDKFFEKIGNKGNITYEGIMKALKSKDDLKHEVLNGWTKLLRDDGGP